MSLRRLVINFGREGVEVRVLYRRASPSPNPSTKARRREVEQLARAGLERALSALEAGRVESVGEAGFETREDVLCADTP